MCEYVAHTQLFTSQRHKSLLLRLSGRNKCDDAAGSMSFLNIPAWEKNAHAELHLLMQMCQFEPFSSVFGGCRYRCVLHTSLSENVSLRENVSVSASVKTKRRPGEYFIPVSCLSPALHRNLDQ